MGFNNVDPARDMIKAKMAVASSKVVSANVDVAKSRFAPTLNQELGLCDDQLAVSNTTTSMTSATQAACYYAAESANTQTSQPHSKIYFFSTLQTFVHTILVNALRKPSYFFITPYDTYYPHFDKMAITTAISDLVHFVYESIASVFHAIYGIIHGLISGIVGLFTGLLEVIGNAISSLGAVVGSVTSFVAGKHKSYSAVTQSRF